ncbi:hypothetical protein ASD79_09415 [Caulobacter sp. Root655]|uniref:hypothetical protein n=1 Tax=Caulobacter sp. Root655 TaxID=1736578 RepID=UPI0006F51BA2|nr:hypothetical protein [Caulobacter sp. Root655]KRA60438.1 hypothetical protein ASD79_09415 [Caulobacter sp. Root655]
MRFWWLLNGERAGLVIVVLVLAAILVLFRPVGHSIPLTGVVTAINVQGGKMQPAFNAWVDLGGSQTVVGLPAQHGCVVGSRIALRKARFSFAQHYFGEHYAISGHGCDVRPATGQ